MKKKGKLSLEFTLLLFGLFFGVHSLLSDFLSVYENYGVSFGIGGNWTLLVNIVFVLFIFGFYLKKNFLSLSLLLVGGLVNLIDRLSFGYVRDYWSLGVIVNNVADWLIGFAVLLFLIEGFYGREIKNSV